MRSTRQQARFAGPAEIGLGFTVYDRGIDVPSVLVTTSLGLYRVR